MIRNREEILSVIRDHRENIRSFGVHRLGLFGSYASGNEHEASDLDFIVEFDQNTFDAYMGLKLFLEDLFKCKIDLVLSSSIKPRLRSTILGQTVYAQGL